MQSVQNLNFEQILQFYKVDFFPFGSPNEITQLVFYTIELPECTYVVYYEELTK